MRMPQAAVLHGVSPMLSCLRASKVARPVKLSTSDNGSATAFRRCSDGPGPGTASKNDETSGNTFMSSTPSSNMPTYVALANAFAAEGVDHHFTLMGDGNMHWVTAMK